MQKRNSLYVYFAVVVNMLRNSRIGMHCMNGSPVKPSWQTQLAVWSRQVHLAPSPQMCPSAHGSTQCWFRQTMCGAQSLLRVHSGWQPVCGSPAMSGKHEHAALPPITWQSVFGPQGLGMHGFPMGKRSETGTQLKILSTKHYFRLIYKIFSSRKWFLVLTTNRSKYNCYVLFYHSKQSFKSWVYIPASNNGARPKRLKGSRVFRGDLSPSPLAKFSSLSRKYPF